MVREIGCVAVLLTAATFPQQTNAQTNIPLGAEPRVDTLFTVDPNSGAKALYQIVEGYFISSLLRDGFGNLNVAVRKNGAAYEASVASLDNQQYADKFTKILSAGDIADVAVKAMRAAGRWKPDWEFLMPLGMAIVNNKTLEIMDFPPNTLIPKRDYLNSKTTDRWFALLEENGASSIGLQGFTAILDIAPIAAPANDGKALLAANVYGGDFDTYTSQMLDLWTSTPDTQTRKPAVAFGSPIRIWLKRLYGLTLNVLDVAAIPMKNTTIPILMSNHPAYIFYISTFADAFYVMQQDLAAACWQSEMGNNPKQDPTKIRNSCVSNWKGQDFEICKLTEMQAFRMTPGAAVIACNQKTLPPPPPAAEMLTSFPGDDVLRAE